ncbi:MAG: autotransporter-associated beta strand repeat-containing protein [Thermoguttaceae bacterium]|jgi:autotransporter-associated beta strand protein|nr:autotransporter-associated beta strand repeat-containing protein [Thermoguttaceae bacterium]
MNTSCRWLRSLGFLFVPLALLLTAEVGAKVIEYTFDAPTPLYPTFESDGITGFGLTKGVDTLTLQAPVNYGYPTDPGLRVLDITASGTVQDAIDKNMYFEFGFHIDDSAYSDILHGAIVSFDVGRGGSGTRGVGLASSVDNFSTLLLSDDVPTTRPIFTHYSTALTGSMFQGLSGDVTFRMYVYSPSAGSSLEFDNILIASPGEGMWFGDVDNNWSTAANWATGNVPVSGSATTITLGNTEHTTSVQDISEPFSLNRLNIVGMGQGVSLSGDALRFVADGGTSPVLHHVPHAVSTIANSVELATTTFAQIDAGGLTLAGGISGAGRTLEKWGAGVLTLAGDNTLATIRLQQGELAVRSDATLSVSDRIKLQGSNVTFRSADANTLTVGSTAVPITIDVCNHVILGSSGTGNIVFHGDLLGGNGAKTMVINNLVTTFHGSIQGGDNPITKTGPGTLVFVNSAITKPITISQGTLQIGDGGDTGTLGSVDVINDAELVINRSGELTVGQAISGTGNLTKTGDGTLVLGGANTYSGTTTVSDGTLRLAHSLALQNSTLTTGRVEFDASAGTAFTLGALSGSGNLTLENTAAQPITLKVGKNDETTQFSGSLSGGGALVKIGDGVLTLSGNNTYSGLTTIEAGTVILGSATALGATAAGTEIGANGTLDLYGKNIQGEAITVAGTITNTLSDQSNALRNVTLSGDAVFTGTHRWDIRAGGGVLDLDTFTATKTGTNRVHLVDVTVSGSGGITVEQGILGLTRSSWATGTLTVDAAGTVDFENNSTTHTYTMDIALNGGMLRTVGNNTTVGGNITLAGTNTLQVNDGISLNVTGDISGADGLTKTQGGTLVLSGNNSYEGVTTITAGTIRVGHVSALGSTAAGTEIGANGTLDLYGQNIQGEAIAVAGTITNTGSLQMYALRNVTLSGNAIFTGSSRWDIRGGGALDLGSYTATKMGSNDVHVVDSTIRGTGGITVDQGALALTRSSWAAGTLTVNAGGTGYFENNDGANHSYSMDIIVNGGTIRSFGGDTTVNSAIQLTGTTTFRPDNHSLRLHGAISGTGSLTKTHAGTLVLTGENTYEGGTTISAGTLMVSNTSGSGTGSGPVSVNPATPGTDAILGGTGTIDGTVTVHSGGMHAPGASVGEQTIGGAVWHSGGMFQFEINDALGFAGGGLDGLGWDLVTINDGAGTGKLDLTDLGEGGQFEIHIVSLDGTSPGEIANFNPTVAYDWMFVTYDELVDDYFDPNLFAVNAGGFQNGIGEGHFAVTQVPGGLALSFIPEPGTAMLAALGLLALLGCRRRRCR